MWNGNVPGGRWFAGDVGAWPGQSEMAQRAFSTEMPCAESSRGAVLRRHQQQSRAPGPIAKELSRGFHLLARRRVAKPAEQRLRIRCGEVRRMALDDLDCVVQGSDRLVGMNDEMYGRMNGKSGTHDDENP
jgi:hypothetical protein